ncbi:pilus assembly protein PilP [Microbulbifer sp. JMSA004]|uniref:pilus assembly protein PilP n=1 Tax=unclassified Microbulbifer TaxID=2619833 RepID=UPI0024ACDC54|nr:pilus assembly protein PilP [Microbulbifer sp. VAAF005]WHI44567.1 pilus assembly protein PilP [Microbulbifer sp. VAAF005]
MIKNLAIVAAFLVIAGCDSSSDYTELRDRMAKVESRPKGQIEPIPTFTPYSPYIYAAAAQRSPFTRPVLESEQRIVGRRLDIAPDLTRQRELLEGVSIDAISMVGSLSQDGQIWALINDGAGGIHRITVGNYLGKNHGRVVNATNAQLDILEIIPDGTGGWIERPRALTLEERDNG